mgnify:CR=1 FL=1
MSKLTPEARSYCFAAIMELPREQMVEMLESIGCACYDYETEETFAESIVDSIEAKDIEFEWGIWDAKSKSHSTYMLWLDIEDIWE